MPIDNTKGELNLSNLTIATSATSDDLIQILDVQSDGQGAGKAISVGDLFAGGSSVGGTAASASLWLQSGSYVTGSVGVNEVSGALTASVLIPVNIAGAVYYIEGFKGKSN